MSKNFKQGDKVWAKMDGYPWWPAKVASDDIKHELTKSKKFDGAAILFFGSELTYGLVPYTDIANFDEFYKTYSASDIPADLQEEFSLALNMVITKFDMEDPPLEISCDDESEVECEKIQTPKQQKRKAKDDGKLINKKPKKEAEGKALIVDYKKKQIELEERKHENKDESELSQESNHNLAKLDKNEEDSELSQESTQQPIQDVELKENKSTSSDKVDNADTKNTDKSKVTPDKSQKMELDAKVLDHKDSVKSKESLKKNKKGVDVSAIDERSADLSFDEENKTDQSMNNKEPVKYDLHDGNSVVREDLPGVKLNDSSVSKKDSKPENLASKKDKKSSSASVKSQK